MSEQVIMSFVFFWNQADMHKINLGASVGKNRLPEPFVHIILTEINKKKHEAQFEVQQYKYVH